MAVLKTITAAVACLASISVANPIINRQALNFDYNGQKVRGVNLGGWFVLEPWITPSLFQEGGPVDEYSLSASLGQTEAHNRLSNHWNTFITEDDFKQIAAAGLNHVRIPVGYWAINPQPGDPYVQGQLDVLDKAVGWARSAGLKILLDLHGAPGSQNGFDNSGKYGAINWQTGNNVQQTLVAIDKLAAKYASSSDVITAIQLLNEPLGPALDMSAVKQFYYDGFGNVRQHQPETAICIHDAFQDIVNYWNGFMNVQSGVNNIILDHHDYQIFSDGEVSRSHQEHVSTACGVGNRVKQTDKWLIVGEWTGAETDCAKWLNGLGKGARYDGTLAGSTSHGSCDGKYSGKVANLSQQDKTNIRQYIEAQLDAFEQHTGWVFWTWKTEGAPEWDFQDLLQNGIIPQPITSRQFGGQCGY